MKTIQAKKISVDEVEKIFPNEYYNKYAQHLKILQFEKLCSEGPKKKGQLKFVQRKSTKAQKVSPVSERTVRINRYDNVEEIIQKNKEQLKRANKYSSSLDQKLKMGPQKKENVIKLPRKEKKSISEEVLVKLQAIDDEQFEGKAEQRKKIKQKQEKSLKCKFISRSKSNSQLNQNSIMKLTKAFENKLKTISNPSRIDINTKFLDNVSDIESNPKRIQNSLTMRGTITTSKRINETKKAPTTSDLRVSIGIGQRNRIKENLLALTEQVRSQANSLEPIKLFDELQHYKKIKQVISQ